MHATPRRGQDAARRSSRRSRPTARRRSGVRRLAQRQIDAGMHFLVPCGTTGESPTLTRGRARPRRRARRRGSGGAGPGARGGRRLRHARGHAAALRMQQAGAEGILSVTPYYNKPTPGRPVSALQRDCRGGRAADRSSTTCRGAPAATSSRRRSSAWRRSRTSSASRRRRATCRRSARSAAPCRRASSSCRATMR